MEEGLPTLNFVRNNPFFKKDAEKRMSSSFCAGIPVEPPSKKQTKEIVPDPVPTRSRSAFNLSSSSTAPASIPVPVKRSSPPSTSNPALSKSSSSSTTSYVSPAASKQPVVTTTVTATVTGFRASAPSRPPSSSRPVSVVIAVPSTVAVEATASRSRTDPSKADAPRPRTTIIAGTVVTMRSKSHDPNKRESMAARRETVEILMEEIVRENRKKADEEAEEAARIAAAEQEERASIGSASDLEYGPGIVEKLKAKFASRFTGGDPTKKKAKRYRSVDDILSADDTAERDNFTNFQRVYASPAMERTTQTLDRTPPKHRPVAAPALVRRASRSMADLSDERRPFVVHRSIVRDSSEGGDSDERRNRLSFNPDDMVDIRELRRLFDQPTTGGGAPMQTRKQPEPHRDRFIERGRTHQNVPPPVTDNRRDVPPPRELRLSAPMKHIEIEPVDRVEPPAPPKPTRKSAPPVRQVSESHLHDVAIASRAAEDEPEFVRIGRRLRRSTVDLKWSDRDPDAKMLDTRYTAAVSPKAPSDAAIPSPPREKTTEEEAADSEVHAINHVKTTRTPREDPLSVVTSPPDPAPLPATSTAAFSPTPYSSPRPSSDVSPPPEEPKPPMRSLHVDTSSMSSQPSSRYSSLARSEAGAEKAALIDGELAPRSESPRRELRDFRYSRSVSRDSSSSARRSRIADKNAPKLPFPKILPPRNDDSGVAEMQRLLTRFNGRKSWEDREREKEQAEEEERSRREQEETEREEQRKRAEQRQAEQREMEEQTKRAEQRQKAEQREREDEREREEKRKRQEADRLLREREAKQEEERAARQADKPRFVPAIVGIRSSDGRQLLSPAHAPQQAAGAGNTVVQQTPSQPTAPLPLNVVSISVRDSTASVIYTNERRTDEDSVISKEDADSVGGYELRKSSIGSSLSCDSTTESSSEDEVRTGEYSVYAAATAAAPLYKDAASQNVKSLTARYLEEKSVVSTPPSCPPPPLPSRINKFYGDEEIGQSPVEETPSTGDLKVEDMEEHELHDDPTPEFVPTPIDEDYGSLENEDYGSLEMEIEEEEIHEEKGSEADSLEKEDETTSYDVTPHEEGNVVLLRATGLRNDHQFAPDSDTEDELETTDDEGDVEDIASRHLRLSFSSMTQNLIAGDGNPVRHSLLHLAMDEDVPALLEAMSETYAFEFEDLDASRASTSNGIIKKGGEKKKKGSIAFTPVATGVYTYLDESSAEGEEWILGAAVSYEEYQEMCASATDDEYRRSMEELARWNAAIQDADPVKVEQALAEIQASRHMPMIYST